MNYATLNMHVGSLTSDSTVSWICEDGNYQLNKRSQVRSIRPWTLCHSEGRSLNLGQPVMPRDG
jgi:hypothetical protein